MSKLSVFQVLDKMSKEDMDIVLFPDVLQAQRNGARKAPGGKITIGVPDPHFTEIIDQMAGRGETHYLLVYKVNAKQFDKIKDGK